MITSITIPIQNDIYECFEIVKDGIHKLGTKCNKTIIVFNTLVVYACDSNLSKKKQHERLCSPEIIKFVAGLRGPIKLSAYGDHFIKNKTIHDLHTAMNKITIHEFGFNIFCQIVDSNTQKEIDTSVFLNKLKQLDQLKQIEEYLDYFELQPLCFTLNVLEQNSKVRLSIECGGDCYFDNVVIYDEKDWINI